MKIAIHHRPGSYSDRWIEYCEENNIPYKIVNAYDTDIIQQVKDCDAFMWHHYHYDPIDALFAKQLLFSLEQAGKIVFPNFKTGWHYDDKLGQKYLFEACGIKSAHAYVFYDKKVAYNWIAHTDFPKVFKLRKGFGSRNVMLAHNKKEAKKFVRKAFGKGFPQFDGMRYFKDRFENYKSGKITLLNLIRSSFRIIIPPKYSRIMNKEIGYVYFQDFIPNEGFDYRIELTGEKAIALKRYVRPNDFRASGSHNNIYDNQLIEKDVIRFAFNIAEKLEMQTVALDIVRNKKTSELYLIEICYCYGLDEDEFDHGYWTKNGEWHDEKFDSRDWMVDAVIEEYNKKTNSMF